MEFQKWISIPFKILKISFILWDSFVFNKIPCFRKDNKIKINACLRVSEIIQF